MAVFKALLNESVSVIVLRHYGGLAAIPLFLKDNPNLKSLTHVFLAGEEYNVISPPINPRVSSLNINIGNNNAYGKGFGNARFILADEEYRIINVRPVILYPEAAADVDAYIEALKSFFTNSPAQKNRNEVHYNDVRIDFDTEDDREEYLNNHAVWYEEAKTKLKLHTPKVDDEVYLWLNFAYLHLLAILPE